jgi:beta-glucanase (GH16 family)
MRRASLATTASLAIGVAIAATSAVVLGSGGPDASGPLSLNESVSASPVQASLQTSSPPAPSSTPARTFAAPPAPTRAPSPTPALPALPAPASTPASGGWTLTWQDEFNDPADTRPRSSTWVFDLGGEPQWGNQEWQYYTDRPQNVSSDGNGNLAITARREKLPGMQNCPYGTCDLTSGRITTRSTFNQAYGRFEARIKIPGGQGLWPAFWMLGKNIDSVGWPRSGEIDIMEVIGRQPGTLYGTLHGPEYSGAAGLGGFTTLPAGARFSDAFHIFAVEWSADRVIWTVDGRQYFSYARTQLPAGKVWVFDHPFFIILNLAVGGGWPGSPDASTVFPATMLVDYVRAYRAT